MTNFSQNIFHTLKANPAKVVLEWKDSGMREEITGQDVLDRISGARCLLQKAGIKEKQTVLLALPVDIGLISGLLAVMAIGAIPVLPPPKPSTKSIWQIIRAQHVKAVLVAKKPSVWRKIMAQMAGLKLVVLPTEQETSPLPPQPPLQVPEDQPALISHSSGSTGNPKAIVRSHGVLQAQHLALKASFPPTADQRDFPLFPNVLLHNLSLGIVSIIPHGPWSNPLEFDPAALIQQIKDQKVESMTGNVFYFNRLVRHLQTNPMTLTGVKAVGIGGSPVPDALPQQLKKFFPLADVYIIYGSSEAEPIAIRKVGAEVISDGLGYNVGLVHPTLEIQFSPLGSIRLPNGKTQPVGEINVRGNHVAVPAKNQWLATGDFGYLDENNNLLLTGRKGNETILHGIQHYQIEQALHQVAGVERAAARVIQAQFVLYVQGNASEEIIKNKLQEHFPWLTTPAIHFRKNLPVDHRHHSKILYPNLR